MTKPNFTLFICIAMLFSTTCQSDQTRDSEEVAKDDVIEIITEVMDFQMPDTIPSGWNTFRFINKSEEVHFFLLDKYPEGKTIEDARREIIPVFQRGMDLINEGKPEEGFEQFNSLPPWFFEVVFVGGSGLVSPDHTAETTIRLEPGYYIVECYIKMVNGMFHATMGMVKELIVKEEQSGNTPPVADIKLTISSEDGIVYRDAINKGEQVFSVHFQDQIAHENFVGHDISLVRLDDHADLSLLEKWMNWAEPEGLRTPSPAGVTFLGGVNDMPAGRTGYFTATFDPGRYALISEVPNASSKNMLKTFEVLDEVQ